MLLKLVFYDLLSRFKDDAVSAVFIGFINLLPYGIDRLNLFLI